MKNALTSFRIPLFRALSVRAVLAAVMLALAGSAAHAQQTTLLNASYDVAREFYKDYNPLFVAYWKAKTGQSFTVNQSHGGSSKQARAVADGLEADVVTMNAALDIDFLADKGLVAPDWQKRFPNNASPSYSTMLFVVRHGNPKGIKDWDDLIKPGVQVIIVNPKTGGNGKYSYLAAWGYVKKKGGTDAQAAEFVKKLLANVPVLDTGGRAATTTFIQRSIGDVLITFESEVIQINNEFGAGSVDAVYPSISILAENPVAVVERVVDKRHTREPATAYLNYLYSEDAQDLIARHYIRPRSAKAAAKYAANFKNIPLFTVDEVFGGFRAAQKRHFDDGGEFDKIFLELGKR